MFKNVAKLISESLDKLLLHQRWWGYVKEGLRVSLNRVRYESRRNTKPRGLPAFIFISKETLLSSESRDEIYKLQLKNEYFNCVENMASIVKEDILSIIKVGLLYLSLGNNV